MSATIRPATVDPTSNPLHELENYWRASLGTQIGWELDFWGKFRRGVESADASYLASIATYDDVLVTLARRRRDDLYRHPHACSSNSPSRRTTSSSRRRRWPIARDRYHGGTATKLDVYPGGERSGADGI